MFNYELIKSSLKTIFRELLNLIYNENCVVCRKPNKEGALCKSCAKTVEILPPFAHKKLEGVEIFSVSVYDGVIKDLIHSLKFGHMRSCARILASTLGKYYNSLLEYEKSKNGNLDKFKHAVVVAVPTHQANINQRGYNNVFEVAKIFAQEQGLRLNQEILSKIRRTKPMYKIRANQRSLNIKGAFCVNKNYYNNETIIIIDDIITTGATLEEIISEFKKEGINNLICVTLSKAV